MLAACMMGAGGLHLIWGRGGPSTGRPLNGIASSIDAMLILVCVRMAWRSAHPRDVAAPPATGASSFRGRRRNVVSSDRGYALNSGRPPPGWARRRSQWPAGDYPELRPIYRAPLRSGTLFGSRNSSRVTGRFAMPGCFAPSRLPPQRASSSRLHSCGFPTSTASCEKVGTGFSRTTMRPQILRAGCVIRNSRSPL